MVCYGAGLRICEAVAVKVKDIDASRMLLRVENGNGGKDRYTLLSQRLLSVLTLAPQEFLRRFLMHTMPSGFQRIRHYGLFSTGGESWNWTIAGA